MAVKGSSRVTHSSRNRMERVSESSLSAVDMLMRDTIREHIECFPYARWKEKDYWNYANQLAATFKKSAAQMRKAIYNRKNHIERKIMQKVVVLEVVDEKSPRIDIIASEVKTLALNVACYVIDHKQKIIDLINSKKEKK